MSFAPESTGNADSCSRTQTKIAGQVGTQGLGAYKAARYIGAPTVKDLREKVIETLVSENEDEHMRHAACLPLQGVWTTWTDTTRPFDLSWENLIATPPSLIKFVLNAQINSV